MWESDLRRDVSVAREGDVSARRRPKSRSITIRLDAIEAEAIVDAVVDCAMEGLDWNSIAANAPETWGDNWQHKRDVATRAADRLNRAVKKARRKRP